MSHEDPDTMEDLKVLMAQIAGINSRIRSEATTRKTRGGQKYPIQKGYAPAVRRPVLDIIKWMDKVELVLGVLVNDLEGREL